MDASTGLYVTLQVSVKQFGVGEPQEHLQAGFAVLAHAVSDRITGLVGCVIAGGGLTLRITASPHGGAVFYGT